MKSLTYLFTSRVRLLAVLCATLIFAAGTSAQAAPVLFNAAGTGPAGATVVLNFDEQVGNALAVGAVPLISALQATGGTTAAFTVYYQANVQLTRPDGSIIDTGTTRITAVAKFQEVAIVTAGSNTVQFANAVDQTGSYFNFFAHTGSAIGNNATGVGFANDTAGATLIYSARAAIDGPPNGNFTNQGGSVPLTEGSSQQTVNGFGGTGVSFDTVFFNGNYFIGDPGFAISLDTTNILPFKTVAPSSQFVNLTGAGAGSTFTGYVAPALGAINGLNGNDIQFQSDASSTFAIPEPASVAMTAIGLVGMGVFASRRRKAAVA